MFEPVETIEQLFDSVRQYQVAIKAKVVRPSRVLNWYYIPSLEMLGAAEFIGYKNIKVDYFAESHVSVHEAELHLKAKEWFRELEQTEPYYARAYSLAESMSKTRMVNRGARFHILKDGLDKDIKK